MLTALFVALKTGFLEKAGEWSFERVKSFFWNGRKKKPRRRDDMVTIGALQQHVSDLLGFKKVVEKRLSLTEKRLEACQGERTECRADLKNLIMRVSALERK